MTYDDIRLNVYDLLGLSSAPPAAVITRIGRHINRWHRKILTTPTLRSLRRVQVTQASVANTFDYGIQLAEIHYITERTNQRRLTKGTEDWWRRIAPDPTQWTGTPTHWVPLGSTRTQRRPSNASEIFVGSTSASDNTQTAYVEVIRSTGYPRSLSVALTGTTFVSLSAAITDVEDVVDFYLSAAAVGTVTLREDSGTGTVLSTIPIGSSYPRFLRYALVPRPSAAITYYLDGLADIVDMSIATDRPLLPDDFHDLLIEAAVYEDLRAFGGRNRADSLAEAKAELARRFGELRAWVWMQNVQGEEAEPAPPTAEEELTLPLT